MNQSLRKASAITVDQESPFEIYELFFSRTDKKGMILAGNEVFSRVAGYKIEEMLNRPHNIIRHPDMPKAVFQYFWETLKSNQPIIAYIKNRAVDGRYYWVLAAAFPTPEGYISIRLKPTTDLFLKVKALYSEMLELERRGSVERSYEYLFEQIKKLGFESYREFSKQVLLKEFEERERILSQSESAIPWTKSDHSLKLVCRDVDPQWVQTLKAAGESCQRISSSYQSMFQMLDEISRLNAVISEESKKIKQSYQSASLLSINMAISSDHSGEEGRPLIVIAETFGKWAKESSDALEKFASSMDAVMKYLEGASFNAASSRLQISMMEFWIKEIQQKSDSKEIQDQQRTEFVEFVNLASGVLGSSCQDVETFLSGAHTLSLYLENLKQAMNALYIIRQSGNVEVARLGHEVESFRQQLKETGTFVNSVMRSVDLIDKANATIESNMKSIRGQLRFAIDHLKII